MTIGTDSYGGDFSNFGYSNTFGRLGFRVDYAVNGTPGPLTTRRTDAARSIDLLVTDSHGNPIALPASTVTNSDPPGQYNTRNEASTEPLVLGSA